MKVSKRQLQSIIKEEKSKLLSERQLGPMVPAQPITRKPTINEQTDNPYLEALQSVAESSSACLESLEIASRDIGPGDKALYDEMDEAMYILENLATLAQRAISEIRTKGMNV